MKKKLTTALVITMFLIFSCLGLYSFYENYRLEDIVRKQNELIQKATGNDSEYLNETETYTDSIKNYTERISFIINGKRVSSDQFAKLFDKVTSERDSIKYALENEKFKFNYAKKYHGFDVFTYEKGDIMYVSSNFSRADSAALTYKYFNKRIKRGSEKDTWDIDVFGSDEDKKKLQEIGKKAREIIQSDTSKKN